jgi:hypothetical protein
MSKYTVQIEDVKAIKDRRDIPGFLRKINVEKVCEIGVKEGANFTNLLVPCVQKAVAIDCWVETGIRSQNDDNCSFDVLNKQYQNMLNLANRDKRVQVIKDFSLNVCLQFEDNYFDFVYIDADHTESAVYADLNAWYKKVRPGGVLAGHDYCDMTLIYGPETVKFGVIPAVNKFVQENKLQLHVDNEEPWHDWFIVKP